MKDLEKTCGLLGSLPQSETLGSLEKGIRLAEQGIQVCMLSVGEPDFDTPDSVKEACRKSRLQRFQRYMVRQSPDDRQMNDFRGELNRTQYRS